MPRQMQPHLRSGAMPLCPARHDSSAAGAGLCHLHAYMGRHMAILLLPKDAGLACKWIPCRSEQRRVMWSAHLCSHMGFIAQAKCFHACARHWATNLMWL